MKRKKTYTLFLNTDNSINILKQKYYKNLCAKELRLISCTNQPNQNNK